MRWPRELSPCHQLLTAWIQSVEPMVGVEIGTLKLSSDRIRTQPHMYRDIQKHTKNFLEPKVKLKKDVLSQATSRGYNKEFHSQEGALIDE